MSDLAQFAIVGSGPSAFYAAENLVRSERACRIDMFERLPVPYGLVRYGVAPDHQKLKSVAAVFERIGAHDSIRWCGGVEIGRDLSIAELRDHYHAVIIACGTPTARTLDVPGETLEGVCASSAFVGWYNGHPDNRAAPLDLSAHSVAVFGHGNVAIDATRLLSKPASELAVSDVPNQVLERFRTSQVKCVHLIGRGAPDRAKFTAKELRELGELTDVKVSFPQGAEQLLEWLKTSAGNADLLPVWQTLTQQNKSAFHREIQIWFGLAADRFVGERRIEAVQLRAVDERYAREWHGATLDIGHAITCIGYRGASMLGIAFDEARGTIPNASGRVLDANRAHVPGLYVTGWIKRGPTGVIGTNRADSVETTTALLEDWPRITAATKSGASAIDPLLRQRGVRVFSFADWQRIDRAERERARAGAPREKLLSQDDVVEVLSGAAA